MLGEAAGELRDARMGLVLEDRAPAGAVGVVLFHSLDRWTDLAELASLAATLPSLSKVEIVGPKAPDVGAFSTLTARGVTVTARALVPRSGRAGGMAGG